MRQCALRGSLMQEVEHAQTLVPGVVVLTMSRKCLCGDVRAVTERREQATAFPRSRAAIQAELDKEPRTSYCTSHASHERSSEKGKGAKCAKHGHEHGVRSRAPTTVRVVYRDA